MTEAMTCNHLDADWLRSHGPARCEVCGYVDTAGRQINPITGRRLKRASEPRIELLYAADEDDTLLFVPRSLGHDMLDARRRVARCHTWGDARRLLSDAWHARLLDERAVGIPDDDEALDDVPREVVSAADRGSAAQ
jgi:hypothetical protein